LAATAQAKSEKPADNQPAKQFFGKHATPQTPIQHLTRLYIRGVREKITTIHQQAQKDQKS